ncbi:MAG TPA: penicillin-binding protein 2 [bacterium]|nr:penicillin-binding protein 2 [bacterium]
MVEQTSPEKSYGRSLNIFMSAVIVAFLILLGRLWFLQIIQGPKLTERSEANRIRAYRITGSRGMIKDRFGDVIVDNRPSFDLLFNPRAVNEGEEIQYLRGLAGKVELDLGVIQSRMDANKNRTTIKIKEDITRDELARIETLSMFYQGHEYPLRIEKVGKRTFKFGQYFAHIVGYTGEIDQDRLEAPEYAGYRAGDRVGRFGVESFYEQFLRGEFGLRKVEEDARGHRIRALEYTPALPGKDLELNLIVELQQTASRAMGIYAGSVVALDPRNGQVLALYSAPSFDPELFNQPLTQAQWDALVNDSLKPLQNKVIGGMYPPGSTFKVVSALAGLQEKEITPRTTFECRGQWKYGDRFFRCHNEKGHGWVPLMVSLMRSCDIYYYKLSVQLGIERIARYAQFLGGGRKTGIDLDGELSGLIPTPEWKMQRYSQEWMPGETLNTSIGQGSVLMTPLQLAVMYAAIANGGTLYQPQVVRRIVAPDGSPIKEFAPHVMGESEIDQKNFDYVRQALISVVNNPGGTAYAARMKNLTVAGKTGTSQVRRIGKQRMHISTLPYEHRDHALFACFAPANDPKIVVVVVAEHAGHGSSVAAPVAMSMLSAYLRVTQQHPELVAPTGEREQK